MNKVFKSQIDVILLFMGTSFHKNYVVSYNKVSDITLQTLLKFYLSKKYNLKHEIYTIIAPVDPYSFSHDSILHIFFLFCRKTHI